MTVRFRYRCLCATGHREPANDLDIEMLQNLVEAMEGFARCAVVISHDHRFPDRLATHRGL